MNPKTCKSLEDVAVAMASSDIAHYVTPVLASIAKSVNEPAWEPRSEEPAMDLDCLGERVVLFVHRGREQALLRAAPSGG